MKKWKKTLVTCCMMGVLIAPNSLPVRAEQVIITADTPREEIVLSQEPTQEPSESPEITESCVPSNKPEVTPMVSNVPTVKPSPAPSKVPVKKPSLVVSKKIVNLGQTLTIRVKNEKGKTVWKSSDRKTATVSNGIVTPKKAGKVTITATNSGCKMNCQIVITDMKFKQTKAYVTVGETAKLTLTGTGNHTVTWRTSRNDILSVSKKGVIKGKKTGSATVTATCRTLSFQCKVYVLANKCILNSYHIKISELPENSGYIILRNITYSGKNLKIEADGYNNYPQKLATASELTITLYQGGKKIASQTYRNRVLNIPSKGQRKMTFIIKDKNVSKKNMDLRTSRLKADIRIGFCSFT